jgi:hypothetical protein
MHPSKHATLLKLGILNDDIQFPVAPDLLGYSEIITLLVREKTLHAAVKTEGFARFLDFTGKLLATGTPEQRLLSVALACKVSNSVKAIRERIVALFETDALEIPLAPLKTISDSDDRYYAANLWRFTSRGWLAAFLACGVLDEESAERSRRECADGLLSRCAEVGEAFNVIEQNLKVLRFSSDGTGLPPSRSRRVTPGDSMGRRMRRVLASVRESVAMSRKESRDDVGPRLRSLLRRAFEQTGAPKDLTVKLELAKESYDLILQIVRTRYTLATLPDTYSPIVTMRDWFTESEWRELSEQELAREFAESIQAAIELAARSGSADNTLFNYLVLACGSTENARALTEQIIDRNTGLSQETIAWLSGNPVRRSTALSTESALGRVDEVIGETMLATLLTSKSVDAVQTDLLPELDVFQSIPRHLLDNLISRVSGLRIQVQTLCDMRRLEAFGTVDTVEEFSPLKHQFEIASDFGAKSVRILQPGVAARQLDDTVRVVRKAIVEPEHGERK